MLTEFLFLQGHKWIDWTLFTASHGWKWRPFYQFPKVWNYSYGNQGLHVENIYDPFINNAYEAGPAYNAMEWFVDKAGQGPNPTWVRERQRLHRMLAKADKILHARFSPQMQVRSFEKEQYYLKQFSLSLYMQWIYKYFPTLLANFVQYKVLPPLVEHTPEIFTTVENGLRRIDYHFANKSVGYHLFIDMMEQLNPPLDDDDRIIPYDYIAESGSRMMQQYKDYIYLSEMMVDVSRDVGRYGELYNDFARLAKEEKFTKMAQGDPFASRFHIPPIEEYCLKFHNFDLYARSRVLLDLKRVTSDFRAHFGPLDLAMATLHKFLFASTTPAVYGQYWSQRRTMRTLNEYDNAAENQHSLNAANNDDRREDVPKAPMGLTKYNPLNSIYRNSRKASEVNLTDKMAQMKHDFELTQNEKIFNLDRANVKTIRTLYNDRDAPLRSVDQLPKELSVLHANIMNEMLTVLPQSLTDEGFVKPLFELYYNNRVNQHVYKYYPSILEPEIKEQLDLQYDRTSTEQYFDYIHDRVETRKKNKIERAEILAPYKAIGIVKSNLASVYNVNQKEFQYTELQLQDQPYDQPFMAYPGDVTLNTDDPTVRYRALQQFGYRQMLNDVQKVEAIERDKALRMTHGWSSMHRKSALFGKDSIHRRVDDPAPASTRRIEQGLAPMLNTKFKNVGLDGTGSDYRPERFSRQDISNFTRVYPGVAFDQVLQVLDDHDTYQPNIQHPAATKASNKMGTQLHTKPIMDWSGLPRRMFGNDEKRQWQAMQHKDELERFREDNKALVQMYQNNFHASNDHALTMKHKYLLSKDAQDLKPHIQ